MNGYQALANGIIEQAVKDYREALRRLKKHPDDKAAMKEAMELEEFFSRRYSKIKARNKGKSKF